MAQKKDKVDYDRVFEPGTFKINIKCNQCGSTNCFIGIKNYSNIDIVCTACGHIEAIC